MLVYADTSALVKLVLDEPESEHLVEWFNETGAQAATSWLTLVELRRAIARSAPWRAPDVADVLNACQLIVLDRETLEAAARLQPATLRTLDAVHLAAALTLGPDLAGMLVYDARLAHAAREAGIRPFAPGAQTG